MVLHWQASWARARHGYMSHLCINNWTFLWAHAYSKWHHPNTDDFDAWLSWFEGCLPAWRTRACPLLCRNPESGIPPWNKGPQFKFLSSKEWWSKITQMIKAPAWSAVHANMLLHWMDVNASVVIPCSYPAMLYVGYRFWMVLIQCPSTLVTTTMVTLSNPYTFEIICI